MAMKVSREDFLGVDEPLKPDFENLAAKMALDFEASVFLRLQELGLKRKDLAQLLGVSPAAVSKLLTENSNMTLKTMARIATVLGCEISPIRLNNVAEVSYIDFDMEYETETVTVPNELISVSNLNSLIGDSRSIANSTHIEGSAEPDPVIAFRGIAA